MNRQHKIGKAKPFIKWVGGKGQLIGQIEALLPADFDTRRDVTYVEPFVGGGAMLFHLLQAHDNVRRAVINDINGDLTNCYRMVKERPTALIQSLRALQTTYLGIEGEDARRAFYLEKRDTFNAKRLSDIENATLLIFLNRTCFNGLYRVNKAGLFNVPFGRYPHPTICDAETILADSELLQKVEITTGDFEATYAYASANTLFYFDPPYRPLSRTSYFNDYAKESFGDEAQRRLKRFCDKVDEAGSLFMLSNSDGMAAESRDSFFYDLYAPYLIERVWARRSVNANGARRGKLTEILVRNYRETIKDAMSFARKVG